MKHSIYSLTIIILATFLGAGTSSAQRGTELSAYDPARVTELSAKSQATRLLAYRWNAEDPFRIADFSHNRLTTCTASQAFKRMLQALSSIRELKRLSPRETKVIQNSTLSQIQISIVVDGIGMDPWTFFIAEKKGSKIIGQSDNMDYAAELALERAPLDAILQGCQVLSRE